MKCHLTLPIISAYALLSTFLLHAEEPSSEIAGLQKAADDFVIAYNKQDAASLAALYVDAGEIRRLQDDEPISGRADIEAFYQKIFETSPRKIAIEVDSVRLVTPNLAIEDGIYHLTPADDENAPPSSIAYTAVLTKVEDGSWKIASTRSLKDVSMGAARLAELAKVLKGEWTHQSTEGVRLDLAFGWDPTGHFLMGDMLTTTADGNPQAGSIRIAWDASKQQILSWMFDAEGGFTQSVWTPSEKGWLIRSEGTTSDGEALSATQTLSTEGNDVLIWAASQRVIGGRNVPDQTLRIVRQAPNPAAQ